MFNFPGIFLGSSDEEGMEEEGEGDDEGDDDDVEGTIVIEAAAAIGEEE